MSSWPYRLLENPAVYSLAQLALAPGRRHLVGRQLKELLGRIDPGRKILDVGCGPDSDLWQVELSPIGVDLSFEYVREFSKDRGRGRGVVCSAASLPFPSQHFDSVWSFGLFHHLDDALASAAIRECLRVCSDSGSVCLIDAVWPQRALTRPIPWLVRAMDRGEHVRRQADWEALFPTDCQHSTKRFLYTYTGLECVVSVLRRSARFGDAAVPC